MNTEIYSSLYSLLIIIIVVIIGTINYTFCSTYRHEIEKHIHSLSSIIFFESSKVVGCLTPVEAVTRACRPTLNSSTVYRRCSGRPAVQRPAGASCPELSCRLIRPEVPNFLCKYNRPCPLPRSCPLYEMRWDSAP